MSPDAKKAAIKAAAAKPPVRGGRNEPVSARAEPVSGAAIHTRRQITDQLLTESRGQSRYA
jgi:hypothetical protein